MKNFSVTGLILLTLFLTSGAQAQFFNGPESVTYDALNGRYLISNVLTGDIAQISDAGDTTYFDTSLTRTLGMTIVDSILYVADISGLVTFDLTTDKKITTKYIVGMNELNDVTADTSGYLYITDVGAGKIFRVRISDNYDTTIISGTTRPNGILFDAQNNRVLFCQFVPNAPIKEIDLNDLSVTTVLSTSLANFDGLAIDGNGYIYVSCWGTNAVYRYDNAFSLPAELVSNGHSGPADIFYNQPDNILAVPNYYSNHVDFIPITSADVDEVNSQVPLAFSMSQNYPNPFNPITKIKYEVPQLTNASLKVYDVLGNEIVTLVNEEKPSGRYQIEFDGVDLPSGIYFYKINAGNYAAAKKMVLMK
ncbi:SMP-30/gluconolactonase/LRE family protein [Bacteroidota bacterium]